MARTIERRHQTGFTTLELVMVMAVMLIVSAIALPSIMRTRRIYQLNGAASQMVDVLKRTRFDAIRGDGAVNCRIRANGTTMLVWSDTNANGVPDPSEVQAFFSAPVTPVAAAGVPGTGALANSVGSGAAIALNPIAPATGVALTFDQRGAVTAPAGVNVVYLAYQGVADPGYRAVIILPSGSVQVWQADSTGTNWHLFD